ncbi:DNA-directed RNA polymerase III subunit C1 (rpo31) [Exophiala dermatitidis]|uniref:DNA-directed RNA polymerase subunit n=2 Tax=Exophiala dermatitidis TaxID=5970 RepID=H6C274_EXODN|nr:DNA-directed RNA polymerase III subunit C1 [Exophiala dermatitidis NIH/UT8656]KAJ4510405.1 DNA-directed RNA polymerase III subunit C1 (rpo31) [Exophiala dermatitidis]EHY58706.1 DNA-directed RNA polymerase III subunit C1 [Exophiala dermatitidis NIH/UT8656]KAJ4510661.1 DNA-directed RNA polymerase III subunit C1 (rpo31) [Exophiala dermatitidis]KAJ4535013.1 DNA-directed RNA polymerase III subunit C1 (rpo31) [Exophiala dermatitidis]KAJ4536081.1 DNA-directed RNA polymerase III subunit C1 (rpo31) 
MPASTEVQAALPGKEQVVNDVPKVIKELHFGVLSDQDIINQSQVELADRRMFDLDKGRTYAEYGPLDRRMGVSGKRDICQTCGEQLQTCNGHFGHVKLVLPVFHVGYFKKVIQILQSICKDCSAILLSEADRRKYHNALRRVANDSLRQAAIVRKVADQCRKTKVCFECGAINGLVRKAGTSALKISHDKFKAFNSSTAAKKQPPPEKIEFDKSFETAKESNQELEKHLKKAMDDLNPLRVLKLFRRIRRSDRELLGLRSAKPEDFLWLYIPAPPVCIRPSVGQEGASTEDDITAKLGDIVAANNALREAIEKGAPVQSVVEHWDYLTLNLAMYINSDVPGLAKGEFGKQIRGFVQRLKGKQGRFRGNLSGKRVDFSGRTVISPDPNLRIDEVAVPILVAKNMTYPEVVNEINIEKLRQRVRNGTKVWPGANYVYKPDGDFRIFLKFGKPELIAKELKEGDIVERHLEDGDIVLFNRQPSLHKLSILSHFVKVRPHRTFRLNECVCNPYNADFDGDEMNLHVPQTEEARTEATLLMGVKHNIVTPKNGEPIISAIQDFITASFLLSSLDQFFDKKTFVTMCIGMLEPDTKFELPPPAVIKPQTLWTGKQVFSVMLRPNKQSPVTVNLDAASRDHSQYHPGLHRDLQDDSFLCIRNSEVLCGRMDKATVGSGKKNSVFYILYRDFGPDAAAQGMNRLSKLCARWLGNQGFTVGISDVTPPDPLVKAKHEMIAKVFEECKAFVRLSKEGKLKRKPGLDDAGTLEAEQIRILSTVRTNIAGLLTAQLSKRNSPMVMAISGSKGSNINVAQMAALLGQQDIEGKRVQDGFQDRTLPHFAKHERSPPSKGFISNSFFSGLLPYEFLFHAVGGRVGLVDTAVKTAETGYMSRRLMKSLEDLSTQYDRTVRNSASNIVQFRFGDDELDPVDMEASAKPVDFDRTFAHVEATTFDMNEPGLSDTEMHAILEEILAPRRKALTRFDFSGAELPFDVDDERMVDQSESQRAFLQSIHDFVMAKARNLIEAKVQKKQYALPPARVTSGSKRKAETEPEEAENEEPATAQRQSGRKGASSASVKKQKTVASDSRAVTRVLAPPSTKDRFDLTCKVSERTLRAFINLCLEKYERARTEPAHAVGAVGAQSIGEPGTQMTLKTFHFAGVAGMSLTAGVPRIKEIINASKDISTPVITCRLERRRDLTIPESLARIVKGRIECLYLEDITSFIQISHSLDKPSCIVLKISLDTIIELGLDLTLTDICNAIQKHRQLKAAKLRIQIRGKDELKIHSDAPIKSTKRGAAARIDEDGQTERLIRLQTLRRVLPSVHILGHPTATRAVVMAEDDPRSDEIKALRRATERAKAEKEKEKQKQRAITLSTEPEIKSENGDDQEKGVKVEEPTEPALPKAAAVDDGKPVQMHRVMVEGYGLRYCMNTEGVDPYHTHTNSVIETLQVLGIEAARSKIILEIQEVMKSLSIDPRHMSLLADVMTYKGEVLGITRFGLAKMRDSVLQLASFEKTADHVFDAGIAGKVDKIEGVSESVIVGKTMGVGTGMVEVVRYLNVDNKDKKKKPTVFEDAWSGKADRVRRKKQ